MCYNVGLKGLKGFYGRCNAVIGKKNYCVIKDMKMILFLFFFKLDLIRIFSKASLGFY